MPATMRGVWWRSGRQTAFKERKLISGCSAMLAYLELCRVGELTSPSAVQPLALEVRLTPFFRFVLNLVALFCHHDCCVRFF